MNKLHEKIIKSYHQGFMDELDGIELQSTESNLLLKKAYEFGKINAILGEDIRGVCYLTDHEIVKEILK